MTEERIKLIVDFWQRTTGRAAPKSIALDRRNLFFGVFCLGEILINWVWSDDETVFHELVHLEQWQDGNLTRNLDLPYHEQPAEIEAFRKSKEYLELFRSEYRDEDATTSLR